MNEPARKVASWYDPEVEFLEIAVEADGHRWWKLYGPDLDARYGSYQGIGGLEAVVDEETHATYAIVDDSFGNVAAYIDLGDLSNAGDDQLHWVKQQMGGYGTFDGFAMQPLEQTGDLLESLAWQSRHIDPTGLFAMGARYYDPTSGSFISADPLGHQASMDLYSYAGGDPINFFDPTGRVSLNEFLDGVAYGVENNLLAEAIVYTNEQFGWFDPDGYLVAGIEGAGEGFMNTIPNTMAYTAAFAVGDGPGSFNFTGALGLGANLGMTRDAEGDYGYTFGFVLGLGAQANYSSDYIDIDGFTFQQDVQISGNTMGAGFSFNIAHYGNSNGIHNMNSGLQGGSAGIPLDAYVAFNANDVFSNDPSAEFDAGVKPAFTAGAGAFWQVNWTWGEEKPESNRWMYSAPEWDSGQGANTSNPTGNIPLLSN